MLGTARQSAILKAVTLRGSCTVSELARELEVAGETIRRDIRVMARQGLVHKVHGGVSVPDQLRESSFRQRLLENAEAKQAIARLAAAQVQSGDSLMIDTGSTTAYVARELVDHRDLMLITNCTEIARTLARGNSNRVFLVGGELRGDDGALFGGEAVRFVGRFRCRVALLSIGAIDLDRTLARVPPLVQAGITDFRARLPIPSDPNEATDYLSEVVAAFRKTVGR